MVSECSSGFATLRLRPKGTRLAPPAHAGACRDPLVSASDLANTGQQRLVRLERGNVAQRLHGSSLRRPARLVFD
jgi:hypothetical protein